MASSQTDEERCNILAEDVIFSEASPGQLTTVWTLNAAAWAEPLSIKDHIERERTLSQQPATSERWKTFVLTLKDNSSEIVASLETFEKPVFVSDGAGCKVEKGYGIASVFTNPKYRGNRMASVLLDKVKQWLDGDGEGWISVLYSDIGGYFYHSLGWSPGSTRTLILETDPRLSDLGEDQGQISLPAVKPLKEEDLQSLCDVDSKTLQSQLQELAKDGKMHFAMVPTYETVSWHIKREDLNAQLIHGRWKPRLRGALSQTGRAWIIWHFDETEKKLKVQRITIQDQLEHDRNVREIASLLRFAQWVAKGSGFMTMLIWNPEDVTILASEFLVSKYEQMKMRIEDRTGSIPCARRRNGELQDSLAWEANEYYAWC